MPRSQEVGDTWTRMAPRWMGDTIHAAVMLRGPKKVEATAFPLVNGKRLILGGTLCGRTFAEMDAGAKYGPWTAGDEDVAVLAFDILDAAKLDDAEFIKPHIKFQIKKNYLPVAWSTAQLAAARAAGYDIIDGTD